MAPVTEDAVHSLELQPMTFIHFMLYSKCFNPLGPNGDQHKFSLNNIHMLPREMVMRVNKMITKEKML